MEYEDLTRKVIGCHRILEGGCLEVISQRAVAIQKVSGIKCKFFIEPFLSVESKSGSSPVLLSDCIIKNINPIRIVRICRINSFE
jgi:hypothetical protein